MDITKLSDQFSVCGQIQPSDLAEIKKLGFRSVICARPDHEVEDQPLFADIDNGARRYSLSTQYIPVDPSGATENNHADFASALAKLPAPILGYCRSGQRVAKLWQARHDQAA